MAKKIDGQVVSGKIKQRLDFNVEMFIVTSGDDPARAHEYMLAGAGMFGMFLGAAGYAGVLMDPNVVTPVPPEVQGVD